MVNSLTQLRQQDGKVIEPRNVLKKIMDLTIHSNMKRTTFIADASKKSLALLIATISAFAASSTFAQDDQDGPANSAQQKPYSELVSEIQENEAKINRLFSSMPIAFPDKQQGYLNEIERLKTSNESLSAQLDEAAYKAYELDPENNVKAGQLVFRQITRRLDPPNENQKFDPKGALEIAAMMMKAGLDNGAIPGAVQFKDVAYQAFRASYALQDFERAQLMLDKINEQGVELRPEISAKLEDTVRKWKEELMIRRLETSNNDLPIVKLETTEGTITLELFENHAPQTVGNFIYLIEQGFYDDKTFFLVQPGKFAQSGCPNGDGSGDAGYRIPCECYREKIRNHFTGTISMANAGKDTASSQFFITEQPNAQWDGRYTAFGRVVEGLEVLFKLQMVDKTKPSARDVTPSKITKATVVRKRGHEYTPTRLKEFGSTNDDSFAQETDR